MLVFSLPCRSEDFCPASQNEFELLSFLHMMEKSNCLHHEIPSLYDARGHLQLIVVV